MVDLKNKIIKAIKKFDLNLSNQIVLTEAATGNYVVTPIIAAVAGAKKVYAYTKNSRYGTVDEVINQSLFIANICHVHDRIEFITDLNQIDLSQINILTNTGFLRPISKELIDYLSTECVIPLMWETWEFRLQDLDLEACRDKKIKVYGTNENDYRLRTKEYIGYMCLHFLLTYKHTPITSTILVIGCHYFTDYITTVLSNNHYTFNVINEYNNPINTSEYDAIIIAEHHNDRLLVGNETAFIPIDQIPLSTNVIHICGNVDFSNASFSFIPSEPSPFGYMSFTADYMGNQVVIDLHTAGLKVAEGMLVANSLDFSQTAYKDFMENNYPAMAFSDERYW